MLASSSTLARCFWQRWERTNTLPRYTRPAHHKTLSVENILIRPAGQRRRDLINSPYHFICHAATLPGDQSEAAATSGLWVTGARTVTFARGGFPPASARLGKTLQRDRIAFVKEKSQTISPRNSQRRTKKTHSSRNHVTVLPRRGRIY